MRITEFNKEPTAKQLNESVAQLFGQKLNLESFTLEQLEDARNKLRTKLNQFESNSNYSAVLENESYTKNKLFLDVLNRAIQEREQQPKVNFTQMEQLVLDKVTEGSIEFVDLPEELQSKVIEAAGTDDQLAEAAPEGWEGTVKGLKKHKDEIDNPYALAWYMKNKGYKSHKKEDVTESVLREGEEEKAELIMSARDMVDRVTGWMEDTANMQAESMLELIDSIRDELGGDYAQEFESVVKPALATIYTALERARQNLTQGVQILTGEGEPLDLMGADEEAQAGNQIIGGEDEVGAEVPETDDFAADASAAGGEEAAGRMTRESIERNRTSKKKV